MSEVPVTGEVEMPKTEGFRFRFGPIQALALLILCVFLWLVITDREAKARFNSVMFRFTRVQDELYRIGTRLDPEYHAAFKAAGIRSDAPVSGTTPDVPGNANGVSGAAVGS